MHIQKFLSQRTHLSSLLQIQVPFKKQTFLINHNHTNVRTSSKLARRSQEKAKNEITIDEFPLTYPDFLPSQVWDRRDPLLTELVQVDMLERRMNIEIPEFYVGSIMAVTMADPNMGNRQNRFVGICIRRHREGLFHQFTLRNVIDGLGVEVMYEMYNPTIQKIEVLILEKRLDEDLSYLIDALPEYSTIDFNLEPVTHPPGKPVTINPLKVKLRPPPWTWKWWLYDLKGIADPWTEATPWFKRKFIATKDVQSSNYNRYDIIRHYRDFAQELEHDLLAQKRMQEFEAERCQRMGLTRRRILKSVALGMV